jgi:TolB protein
MKAGNRLSNTSNLALFAALTLAVIVPRARAADEPARERPDYLIGYTVQRTNLPGGQYPNQITARAFVVKADGTGTRHLAEELTRKPNSFAQFAGWSPDGRQAILHQGWESAENGAWEHKHRTFRFTAEHWLLDIVLCELDSGKLTNLTAVERVSFYNAGLQFWPKRPNRLGILALIGGEQRPYAMDLDGKNKKPLAEGSGFIYGFNTSSDGNRICYHKSYQVYIADADGGNARPIKNGHPFQFCPIWSPTGDWLTFLSGEHYNCHPHIVHADGTGLKKLADRGGYRGVVEGLDEPDFHSENSDVPAWSPDGRWLYYTAKLEGAVELMRVTPNGKVEQLTRSKAGVLNFFPQVAPDSKWVAFGSNRSGVRQLYVARADGSECQAITSVEAGWRAYHGHWRPK